MIRFNEPTTKSLDTSNDFDSKKVALKQAEQLLATPKSINEILHNLPSPETDLQTQSAALDSLENMLMQYQNFDPKNKDHREPVLEAVRFHYIDNPSTPYVIAARVRNILRNLDSTIPYQKLGPQLITWGNDRSVMSRESKLMMLPQKDKEKADEILRLIDDIKDVYIQDTSLDHLTNYDEEKLNSLNQQLERLFTEPVQDKVLRFDRGNDQTDTVSIDSDNFAIVLERNTVQQIHEDTGMWLFHQDYKEFYYLSKVLSKFKQSDDSKIEKLKSLHSKHTSEHFNTMFLALAYADDSLTEKLLELANAEDPSVTKQILERFSESVSKVRKLESNISKDFNITTEEDNQLLADLHNDLMQRAVTHLSRRASMENKAIVDDLDNNDDELQHYRQILRRLKDSENFSWEDASSLRFQTERPADLSAADQSRIESLIQQQYIGRPDFVKELIKSFHKSLKNPDTNFYLVRRNNKILGSFRTAPSETIDQALYLSGFVMDPNIRSSGIGEHMMASSVDILAQQNTLQATAEPGIRAITNYINRGFIGYDISYIKDTPVVNILRNESQRGLFKSNNWSKEEVIKQCPEQPGETWDEHTLTYNVTIPNDEVTIDSFKYLRPQEHENQFILTNFVRQGTLAYLVFEEVTPETISNYQKFDPSLLQN